MWVERATFVLQWLVLALQLVSLTFTLKATRVGKDAAANQRKYHRDVEWLVARIEVLERQRGQR
jgi:hypothetical protein